jgi:hypothetical protein
MCATRTALPRAHSPQTWTARTLFTTTLSTSAWPLPLLACVAWKRSSTSRCLLCFFVASISALSRLSTYLGLQGLVVPVIRNVENMSFLDVERSLSQLSDKARDDKITVEDMAGGTFTISNGGSWLLDAICLYMCVRVCVCVCVLLCSFVTRVIKSVCVDDAADACRCVRLTDGHAHPEPAADGHPGHARHQRPPRRHQGPGLPPICCVFGTWEYLFFVVLSDVALACLSFRRNCAFSLFGRLLFGR